MKRLKAVLKQDPTKKTVTKTALNGSMLSPRWVLKDYGSGYHTSTIVSKNESFVV